MIDISQFAALQKACKDGFAKQKNMMKKVMAGQTVLCPQCQQPLFLITPRQCLTQKTHPAGVRCKKGCTEIQLDFV